MATSVQEKPQERTVRVVGLDGQRAVDLTAPADRTIGELLEGLVPKLRLPSFDSNGQPLSWAAMHQEEARRLLPQEVIGECLEEHDTVRLVPDIEAG
ncbi:MAG: hypothetical protein HYU66_00205 [Armatimonadetes bacterium]|nr:hypothetical protein [Armatimonadota bacterium]